MIYAPPLSSPSQMCFSEPSVNRLRNTRAWQPYEEGLKRLLKPEKAKRHFEQAVIFAIKINKRDAALLANSIGAELGKRKLYNEAFTFIQWALRLDSNLPGAHNNLGNVFHERRQYNEAEKEYREALRLGPDDPGTHNNLGSLLYEQKKYDEAERGYREAIRLRPDSPDTHNNLGILLREQKRYDEAGREYREAIRLRPDYPEAHYNLGNLLKEQKRYDEAERGYREAIRLRPDYPDAHNSLGVLLSCIKRYYEAESEYKKAIELDTKSPLAHINLGVLLSVTDHNDEAEDEFKEALRLFGERETERLEEALRYLEKVSMDHPESYSLWWARGKFLQALGKDVEARECLETAEAFENLEIPDIEHDIIVRMEPIKTWKTVKARVKYMGPAEPRVVVDLEENELLVDKD